ncbi:hypothetical protein [Solibacillus isronensis]|nr:hypothetical protein [Solibacillus isronensis]
MKQILEIIAAILEDVELLLENGRKWVRFKVLLSACRGVQVD